MLLGKQISKIKSNEEVPQNIKSIITLSPASQLKTTSECQTNVHAPLFIVTHYTFKGGEFINA